MIDQQYPEPTGAAPCPPPTSALPSAAGSGRCAAPHGDLARCAVTVVGQDGLGAWPGFPFPPPLMGLSWHSVHAAAAHYLRALAELLEGEEMNLNVLFATGPLALTCEVFGLPGASAGQVVAAAALYALGAGSTQPALTALFAAPATLHPVRLRHAAEQLEQ